MKRSNFLLPCFVLAATIALIFSAVRFVNAKDLSLTTYYPAPSGNYDTLSSRVVTITGGGSFTAGVNTVNNNFYLNAGATMGATPSFVLRSNGMVGIGTAIPQVALHVVGAVTATGVVTGGSFTTAGNIATTAGELRTSSIVYSTSNPNNTITINEGPNAITAFVGRVTVGSTVPSSGEGSVTATNGFWSPSDARLKENVSQITGALEKTLQINGVNYKLKSKPGMKIGFIAQDIEKVLPEVVATDSEGMKSVDYAVVTAVLVEAIKEQQKMIDALKADVEALKKR